VQIFGPSKSLERKNYPPECTGQKVRAGNNPNTQSRSAKNKSFAINTVCSRRQFRRIFEHALRKRGVTGENAAPTS